MRNISEIRRNNVKRIIQDRKMTRAEFADKVGVAYAQLAQYIGENPTKNIGNSVAQRIEKSLGLSENWLDQDWSINNGIIVGGNNANTGIQVGQVLHSNINPANFEKISDWDSSTPLDDNEVGVLFYKDFGVACGHGTDGVAYENEWRRLRMSRATIDRIGSHHDKIFATLADGDSMSPTINDGDTIWVDMSKENIKDGKIFVFEYGGLYMCKRLYRLPNNGLKVVSDNEIDYPTFEITGEQREQNGFRLIGWVWHWSVMERW